MDNDDDNLPPARRGPAAVDTYISHWKRPQPRRRLGLQVPWMTSAVDSYVKFVKPVQFPGQRRREPLPPHSVIVTKKHPIWLPSHRFPARTTTQVCHMLAVVCQRRQTQRATSASTLSSSFQGQ